MATAKSKAMSVSEARARLSTPYEITLPKSGIVMTVKRLTVYDYLSEGIKDIPNDFYGFITTLGKGEGEQKISEEKKQENYKLIEKFINVTLEKGCIEPKMRMTFDQQKIEDALLYTELAVDDQQFLLSAIMGKHEGK